MLNGISEGYLPKWNFIVAVTAFFNTIQTYINLTLTQRVYSAAHHQTPPLQSHLLPPHPSSPPGALPPPAPNSGDAPPRRGHPCLIPVPTNSIHRPTGHPYSNHPIPVDTTVVNPEGTLTLIADHYKLPQKENRVLHK
ncbi:hypothetical protein PORY_000549 [Pneumocystis oryctolagi]|uniref:Uncharacterized protein n=1 Tax=Pneumocystis oryctolagi TaxID=42067 RepID=A0ACB7CFU6_9ASCO|nr:hypothetical protein PORY_000549 [Pneumocystis oryctolagi]